MDKCDCSELARCAQVTVVNRVCCWSDGQFTSLCRWHTQCLSLWCVRVAADSRDDSIYLGKIQVRLTVIVVVYSHSCCFVCWVVDSAAIGSIHSFWTDWKRRFRKTRSIAKLCSWPRRYRISVWSKGYVTSQHFYLTARTLTDNHETALIFFFFLRCWLLPCFCLR